MENKKIVKIEVPRGKRAEWVNGVLTLVDDKPKDIRDRIKTFEDACAELGENHQYVRAYREWMRISYAECEDITAYLKLRIITAALNEGWEPQFTEDEERNYPYFYFYTDEEMSKKSKEWMAHHAMKLLDKHHPDGYNGIACVHAHANTSDTNQCTGVHLCLKNEPLARYCGTQFIDIWADYVFKR